MSEQDIVTILPLDRAAPAELRDLAAQCAPYVAARSESDYWLYAALFSNTCFEARRDNALVGMLIAMRSQLDAQDEIYIQDVAVHPTARRVGIATQLLDYIVEKAHALNCKRIWLTSEADNTAAASTWQKKGFTNPKADYQEHGLWVTRDLKGPGKDRVVFALNL